jgi:hypothetical protein
MSVIRGLEQRHAWFCNSGLLIPTHCLVKGRYLLCRLLGFREMCQQVRSSQIVVATKLASFWVPYPQNISETL